MLVTYDRANQQIGFLRTNCSNLWSILPPEPPTVPPPPGDNQSSPSYSPDSTASASHNEGTPPFQQTASPANLSKFLQLPWQDNFYWYLESSHVCMYQTMVAYWSLDHHIHFWRRCITGHCNADKPYVIVTEILHTEAFALMEGLSGIKFGLLCVWHLWEIVHGLLWYIA